MAFFEPELKNFGVPDADETAGMVSKTLESETIKMFATTKRNKVL